MMHLDADSWRDLLDGALPADRTRRVIAHLEEGCAPCEEFLADAVTRGEVDALDGITDEALLGLTPTTGAELVDELGLARFGRAVRTRGWKRHAIAAAGIALAVAAAALLTISVRSTSPWRLKGGAAISLPTPALEVLQVTDGAPSPLARGAKVPIGAALVFRVKLAEPTCVQLWRVEDSTTALLDRPLCLERGVHVLARDGEALGLRVEQPGPLLFQVGAHGTLRADTEVPAAAPLSVFRVEVVAPAPAGARQ